MQTNCFLKSVNTVAARASSHRMGSNLFTRRTAAASLGSRRRLTLRHGSGGGSGSSSSSAQRSVQGDVTTVSMGHSWDIAKVGQRVIRWRWPAT